MSNCYRITIITAIIVLVFSNLCFGQFSTPIQVTSTGGYHPSVSPNGEWVVFKNAGNGLAKIKTDGTEFTQLTSMIQCYEPDWAKHNDSLILFRHYDSTLGTSLLIVNAFTLDTSFVFGGVFDDGATWSTDGSSIAVQNASPDGIRIISYPDTNITDVACSDDGGVCAGENPTWSPDGEWIAFEDGLEILKVEATGGNAVVVVEGLGDASSPAWSPDGNWIAFTLDSHIWVADYRGTSYDLIQVTSGLVTDYRPTWSPDSDTIFFQRNDGFQSDIWKVGKVESSINEDSPFELPNSFTISQNYPNPFNPTTTIEFNLPTKSMVTVNIYNLLGEKIQQLVNQEYLAGNYKVTWDGTTSNGVQTSTGIYFYRIETESFAETKKMVLLK